MVLQLPKIILFYCSKLTRLSMPIYLLTNFHNDSYQHFTQHHYNITNIPKVRTLYFVGYPSKRYKWMPFNSTSQLLPNSVPSVF